MVLFFGHTASHQLRLLLAGGGAVLGGVAATCGSRRLSGVAVDHAGTLQDGDSESALTHEDDALGVGVVYCEVDAQGVRQRGPGDFAFATYSSHPGLTNQTRNPTRIRTEM